MQSQVSVTVEPFDPLGRGKENDSFQLTSQFHQFLKNVDFYLTTRNLEFSLNLIQAQFWTKAVAPPFGGEMGHLKNFKKVSEAKKQKGGAKEYEKVKS